MNHRMKVRLTLTGRYSPMLRSGPNEHEPGGSAGQAHNIKKASDGMRTVGVLIAVSRVTDRLIDFYALPVGIQFVGHDQGQGGSNYSSHFRAMRDNPDSSVRLDTNEHIGMKRGIIGVSAYIIGLVSVQYFRRVICTHDKRSRRTQPLEEPSSTHIFNRAHAFSSAAALIAARIL